MFENTPLTIGAIVAILGMIASAVLVVNWLNGRLDIMADESDKKVDDARNRAESAVKEARQISESAISILQKEISDLRLDLVKNYASRETFKEAMIHVDTTFEKIVNRIDSLGLEFNKAMVRLFEDKDSK